MEHIAVGLDRIRIALSHFRHGLAALSGPGAGTPEEFISNEAMPSPSDRRAAAQAEWAALEQLIGEHYASGACSSGACSDPGVERYHDESGSGGHRRSLSPLLQGNGVVVWGTGAVTYIRGTVAGRSRYAMECPDQFCGDCGTSRQLHQRSPVDFVYTCPACHPEQYGDTEPPEESGVAQFLRETPRQRYALYDLVQHSLRRQENGSQIHCSPETVEQFLAVTGHNPPIQANVKNRHQCGKCKYYSGNASLICAVHPYGPDHENCRDFERP